MGLCETTPHNIDVTCEGHSILLSPLNIPALVLTVPTYMDALLYIFFTTADRSPGMPRGESLSVMALAPAKPNLQPWDGTTPSLWG